MPETTLYRSVGACRVCRSTPLAPVLSLGGTPLANAFVRPEDRDGPEPRFPLEVLRCNTCGLLQLSIVVRGDVLFRTYPYLSSASPPMAEHFDALADELVRRFRLAGSCAVEIGSNDGVLLRPLAARGVTVVGVEPASNLAALANRAGLETWNEFFGEDVARRIAAAKGRARAILANNVLAHIDDLHEVARSIDLLLDEDGVFVAEVPYLMDLLDYVEYDTIYHEHLSYFALAPLQLLFASAGLEVFDVRRLRVHGGSIRVYVARSGRFARSERLATLDALEAERKLGAPATCAAFSERVSASRTALVTLLGELKRDGKRLAGYGATAKGNTLLNYCGIGRDTLEFIADTTPLKQGLLTPGTHIPVRPDDALMEERPDFVLLLAWNYADAIMRRHASYLSGGGRFIHPIPIARIL